MEVNIQEQSAVGRGLLDHQLTPSSEAIEREKAKAVQIALSQLSQDQRDVIQFRNFERLTFAEIGNRMERSEEAARKLWARSIEALKNSMKSVSPELTDESLGPSENHE